MISCSHWKEMEAFGKVSFDEDDADDLDSDEKYDENAKLVGKMMSYPLLATAKTLRNVKPVDAGFLLSLHSWRQRLLWRC